MTFVFTIFHVLYQSDLSLDGVSCILLQRFSGDNIYTSEFGYFYRLLFFILFGLAEGIVILMHLRIKLDF